MPTAVAWKQKLIKAEDMRQSSVASIYDRAKLLNDVFDDTEFRDDNNLDDLRAAEVLDSYLTDVAASFLELRSVLEMFPNRDQWAQRDLKKMIAEMMDRKASEAPADTGAVRRKRVTRADFEALEQERDELAARVEQLLAENRELRDQLAVTNFRLAELEEAATASAVLA